MNKLAPKLVHTHLTLKYIALFCLLFSGKKDQPLKIAFLFLDVLFITASS